MKSRAPGGVPRTGPLLRLAFAAIVVTFVIGNVIAIYRAGFLQTRNEAVIERMINSVELVSRLGRDIDRKRILIDTHIFETNIADMADIEREIAQVDADLQATVRGYEVFVNGTGERIVWEQLKLRLAALAQPVAEALALSRKNHDAEARALIEREDRDLDSIDRDTTTLIRISRADASNAAGQIRSLHQASLISFAAITLAGLGLGVVVAVLATRLLDRREAELRLSHAKLEERNRDLDAFAGRVAHDLRGPLTSINLAAARLAEHAPQEEGTTAILRRGVARMETLIQDLLTLSRVDAESPGIGTDPAAVAAALTEETRPRVQSEGAILRVAMEPARVKCNEGLLRQVMWNLLENALKYRRSDVRPEIDMQGQVAGSMYELRVADNGIGMSPDEARRSFEPFYRAMRSQDATGTGLGLSIVKRVVEVSGGTLGVDSQLGRGTTFLVKLPLDRRGPMG
jgi:signal transduction histidine kinase